jgi:hypothetical protein
MGEQNLLMFVFCNTAQFDTQINHVSNDAVVLLLLFCLY